MPAISSRENYRWFATALLWFVCFLNYADRQAIFVLFPVLRVDFHLTNMQLAFVGSSFMWAYALFGPLAGWLGDRFSRVRLIQAGLLFWLCVTAATILAHQYWQLALVRGLNGIAEAIFFPAAMSLISSHHTSETRSRAMSVVQSAVSFGTIGGGAAAAILGQHSGWRSVFWALAAIGLGVLLLLHLFLKEPSHTVSVLDSVESFRASGKEESIRDTLTEILGAPRVLRLIAAFIGANFVAMVFMVWLPTFLFGKFHLGLAGSGINATLYLQLGSIGGVICGGVLADMLVRKDRGGRMRTQAIGLIGGVLFLVFIGRTASFPTLIASMTGFGFCKGIYESNIWASLYDVVSPRHRATAVGLMNSLGWLGAGLAPLAIAAGSRRFGMGNCMSATSIIYIVAAAILLWNADSMKRREAAGSDQSRIVTPPKRSNLQWRVYSRR